MRVPGVRCSRGRHRECARFTLVEISGPSWLLGYAGSALVLGIVCTALAFLLFFSLIREAGPTRATVIKYLNPVVALLLVRSLDLDECNRRRHRCFYNDAGSRPRTGS